MITTKEKHIFTLSQISEMHIREFNMFFKSLTLTEMKHILIDNGIWVKSTLKSKDIQELFLDVVDNIVVPTEQDKIKIERSLARKNKAKVEIVLDEVDSEIDRLYKDFKDSRYKEDTISSLVYLGNMSVIGDMPKEEVLRRKKEMKTIARKIYLRIHPDKKSENHIKYTKRFACYNAYFSKYDFMFVERLNEIREQEESEARDLEYSKESKESFNDMMNDIKSMFDEKPKNNMF